MRKPVVIIITIISVIGICFLGIIIYVVISLSSDPQNAGEIIVTLHEEPAMRGYEFEILDKGIIELKEKKKSGGNWGAGYDVTWIFRIIKEGKTRIKWDYPDSEQKWKNSETWIDTYTISSDKKYTVERYYLTERIFYIMCYPVEINNLHVYKGYFIDINGARRYFSIEDPDNAIISVTDLYDYLLNHFSDFNEVEYFKNTGLKKCNLAQNNIEETRYSMSHEFSFEKCTLYGVDDISETPKYVILANDDKTETEDENIKAIMTIFGDDWNRYEP